MGVLLMLMTLGGLILAGILLITALLTRRSWLARFATAGVGVWTLIYTGLLLGSSFMSTEKSLAFYESKQFCGFYLDCHAHATVTGVRREKTIGSATANG